MRSILLALLLTVTAGAAQAAVTEKIYLSGRDRAEAKAWEFYCTGGRNSGVWTTIPVPSCWELQGFGVYEYGVEHSPNDKMPAPPQLADEQGRYRHAFTVPEAWRGRVVRLVFDGVMTDAEVKLNGAPAGPVHQGAFYRFKYDVTNQLRWDGPNVLEVIVSKKSANPSVNAAERQGDYWNFGGIFRPVYLEELPSHFIDRVAIDARADGSFAADVFLGGGVTAAGTELLAQIRTIDGAAVGAPFTVTVPAGSERVAVRAQVPAPALWTAETPRLYVAEFTLRPAAVAGKPGAGEVIHEFAQRFGFRTFEVRAGDGFYLNGQKIVLKGVNRHSFRPESGRTLSQQDNRDDVNLLKEANMNAVRMSHYPPDEAFLDLCDEAGLYVLDELGGWHGAYDTDTGRKLIAEMIGRDVNHPSILFWDNGNEGGENVENDGEFARHDPQHRPVLHPWSNFGGVNTAHYRDYAETDKFSAGPDIFMPTEFLHGLYDGGHGAGLEDYWKLMGERPHAAGGFLWVLADEGAVRTDEGGWIDARRNLGPDGIVGPHHEKEGSFFTIRELWSPVQIPLAELPADFSCVLPVLNRYDFLDLRGCEFEWQLMRFGQPGTLSRSRTLVTHGRIAGSAIPAHGAGELRLPLPADWRESDLLSVTVRDERQRELWTWSWRWKTGVQQAGPAPAAPVGSVAASAENGGELVLAAGRNVVRLDKSTGRLLVLERDGRRISLSNGPRLVAYRHNDRRYEPVATDSRLLRLTSKKDGDAVTASATYDGSLREIRWTVRPDGDIQLDYEFTGPGEVSILGLDFDYPEEKMRAKEWIGAGPYRVWQNRLKGASLARWDVAYNDPVPGQSWQYPEFKGWFGDWQWIAFSTTEGRFAFLNDKGSPFLGAYTPRDGRVGPVLALPRIGLGFYQVIPAMGTKNSRPDQLGPQSQAKNITGIVRGTVVIRLLEP